MGVRTVFMGTGEFGVPALRALVEAPDVDLVGIVTAPSRKAGRKTALGPTPIAAAARALDIGPIQAPERLRRPEVFGDVLGLRPDLVVLADYGQIVPRALLEVRFG